MMMMIRLTKKGSAVTSNAVHPGCVSSDVSRNMGFMTRLEKMFTPLLSLLRKTPSQGAYCSIYAAISPELEGIGGKYLIHCQEAKPSSVCYDEEQAARLWTVSEKITGILKE